MISVERMQPALFNQIMYLCFPLLINIVNFREGYKRVFQIPPDFDDTSVNLGLGSLLKDFISDFPNSAVLWQSRNANLSSIFNALKHYAYRPMSNDTRVNTIDTRTYFYMRRFLEDVKAKNQSLSLVTTWVGT